MKLSIILILISSLYGSYGYSSIKKNELISFKKIASELQKKRHRKSKTFKNKRSQIKKLPATLPKKKTSRLNRPNTFVPVNKKPFFDIPVTYNRQVKKWIKYFQYENRTWFRRRLERSSKYLPVMQEAFRQKGIPQDLAIIALIESGFSPHATSSASAVGYWQFIRTTANRYGLRTNWWIDERRDFVKSTKAAANYLGDLYGMFNSWYLTAASYNMGEGKMRRLIKKYKTTNFWELANKKDFPVETKNYIPKLLAALLISKAPSLYGFRNLTPMHPYTYEYFSVPGGTDLYNMATYLRINKRHLRTLNPELTLGFVPGFVRSHKIRIPKGLTAQVSTYIRTQL